MQKNMMKVVKPSEMSRLEKEAYAQGASEEAFMENAGKGVAEVALTFVKKGQKILLLCGKGNNGGDTYVAGRHLIERGFHVEAFALEPSTHLCKKKRQEFTGKTTYVTSSTDLSFEGFSLLIDGLFGTGFKGSVEGIAAEIIERANESKVPILAVDIPSGVQGDSGIVEGSVIHATATLFLGMPKSGCFLGDAWNYVGKPLIYDFGLDSKGAREDFFLLQQAEVFKLLPKIQRTRHKYARGYVVGLGGSFGMPGALILAGFAALKTGAGIVRVLHPLGMEEEFAGAPYELIREGYRDSKTILERMEKASALFIGPGIGVSSEAEKIVKEILDSVSKPVVIDAEALTLIGKNHLPLPKHAILTPHEGELRRLLHIENKPSKWDLLEMTQKFVEKNNVTVVVKGSPTFIVHPGQKPHISPTGDPGMATAGSGDVLTGMIAAFLAGGLDPFQAACVGVYIHGLAGEYAAKKYTSQSMVASDITEALPQVFRECYCSLS
jgi:hydroxyethylthiazole kinase-like uncharacterized protein yjeF